MKTLIGVILLFISTLSFAQKSEDSGNNYTTVFSGGALIGYRLYNTEKTYASNKDNHFTFGGEAEANLHLYKNIYTGVGLGQSYYKVSGETYPVTNLYLQPSAAFNINNGKETVFAGLRGELIFDKRFFGYSIAPFIRMQFNLSGNYTFGYHFGVQKFGGEEWSFRACNTRGPSPEYYGFALVNYLYAGIRLHK